MSTSPLQLESLYSFEKNRPQARWLIQPMGNGAVKEFTFAEAMAEARRLATHLKSLGLPPKSNIALFSKNTAWWLISDIAIWMAGHISVPLYPTLTAETIGQILDHSESRLIIIGKLDGFAAMEPGIPASLPRILTPLAPNTRGEAWDTIQKASAPMAESPTRPADDLATIIYTSGTTGVPKGVMHSFGTMCASRALVEDLHVTSEDRMLSYLPLSHVFERTIVETGSFCMGFQVFFAESLETFVKDLQRARPTLFVSVPRLWLKFQAGVNEKMPPKKLNRLLSIPIVSGIVKKKILTGLGLDQVRFAGSGSAPIPGPVIDWYRRLGLDLLEGYGMSENFSYSHMTKPGQMKVGTVGTPQRGVEHRIGEGGEILVKSPCNTIGYYKQPELTKELFTPDGFVKTGDQGEIDASGNLRITGRVKELFKTSKGKYVAPAPIENRLLTHPDLEQAMVAGANQGQPFALAVLSLKGKNRLTAGEGRQQLEAELKAHIDDINAKLDSHEQLETLVVVTDEWTAENGLLTPTLKLKRSAIEKKYGGNVETWYRAKTTVIWA
ncbi:MAG: AMP-binding protein [Myxococcaceae bacterium]|jgi:long-subunit acyl-CoA synthetase (AMP-forming)|nr:AMP-binding protein [Myxococcaceae bacterium]